MEKDIIRVGFIICDPDEYKQLKNLIISPIKSFKDKGFFGDKFIIEKERHKIEVNTICSGLGKVNAASAAMYLICNGINVIFNSGYSGGFVDTKDCNVVIGDKFVEHDFDLTPLGYKPSQKPGQDYIWTADSKLLNSLKAFYNKAQVGTFVTGDSFICSEEKGRELVNNFSAIACDMESAAIASVCGRANVKFASIRIISDGGNNESVETYFNSVNEGLKDCLIPSLIFEWLETIDLSNLE